MIEHDYDALEDVLDDLLEEPCRVCHGEGEYHDCGEDACCCADPTAQHMVECEECGGAGRL